MSTAKSVAAEIQRACLELALRAEASRFETVALTLRMAAVAAGEIAESAPADDADEQLPMAPLIGLWDLDVATGKVVSDKVFAEFESTSVIL